MTDADHVSVHTDDSEPSSSHPNEGIITNSNTLEVVTVQQVRDMIDEAYEVQRLEADQRMKELRDHVTSLIKPLQDAIGVLQSSIQGRQTGSETGGSSHAHGKEATYKAFRSTSPPTIEGSNDPIKVAKDREHELALHESDVLTKKPKMTGTSHQNSPRSFFQYSRGRAHSIKSQPSCAPSQDSHGSRPSNVTRPTGACQRCGKYHKGRCSANDPVCYRCGESGHMSFNCPHKGVFYCFLCGELGHTGTRCPSRHTQSDSRGSTARPAATSTPTAPTTSVVPKTSRPTTSDTGRTFQITADEARDSPDVITGTITVNTTLL